MELTLNEPVILFTLNRLYAPALPPDELYEVTRKSWVLNPRRAQKAELAVGVYQGIVVSVYRPTRWYAAKLDAPGYRTKDRWQFDGEVATDYGHWIGKSVADYVGGQNPVRYVNC